MGVSYSFVACSQILHTLVSIVIVRCCLLQDSRRRLKMAPKRVDKEIQKAETLQVADFLEKDQLVLKSSKGVVSHNVQHWYDTLAPTSSPWIPT